MKLYILDKYKISSAYLPKEIKDSVLIPYENSGKKYDATINAVDGQWVLKSNGIFNAYNNGNILPSATLTNYNSILIKIKEQKELYILYSIPSVQNFFTFKIPDKNKITIGSSANNTITYNEIRMKETQAYIQYIDDTPVIYSIDATATVYVNDKRIMSSPLTIGDRIFINGLIIIWMGTFIKINDVPNLSTKLEPINEIYEDTNKSYEELSENLDDIELYSSNDYFSHTPRLKEVIDNEEIEIDPPPTKEVEDQTPLILILGTSLTMGVMSIMNLYTAISGIINGTRTLANALPQIIMSFAMICGSIIIPQISRRWQKKQRIKKEQLRQTKYKEYLQKKEIEIKRNIDNQRIVSNSIYADINQCNQIVLHKNRRLWERTIHDDDFLTIRCGLGNPISKLTIKTPEKRFSLEEDNLKDMVENLVNRYKNISNAPITISLIEHNLIALSATIPQRQSYIEGLILQLITFHSPEDLKLVFFTNNENQTFEYAKYLPHVLVQEENIRLYATNREEMKEVSTFLEKELKKRIETKINKNIETNTNKNNYYRNFKPYYLIITDDLTNAKNAPIIDLFLSTNKNYGFSFMMIENSMNNLPEQCNTFIYATNKASCVFDKDLTSKTQHMFTPEFNPLIEMHNICMKLANIPVLTNNVNNFLPNSLTFLEMYNVSKIEHLNIKNRWINNNPTLSLQAPVGVHTNGDTFYLNLHEKKHGPHGLIAGMTGSGKSEFIITYILSMACNFHPDLVQFVLIDYKGGGLAGAFENREKGIKIPHLIGTITNLDIAEMNRSLVSIDSELKRRQRKFNEVRDQLGEGTIDIYKYQRLYTEGVIKEPIAHLFIICDEFAELKSQRPEFMDKLISTARIGRSLGVHLILATQKPSGVVNDQIWANTRFRVCLKVQDRSDSMEMLKKPDAASIKETGRFYLQVGYDEYFDIGQSGWSGAKYIPTDRTIKKTDDSINFIDDSGDIIKSINNEFKQTNNENYGDQLTNIVKNLIDLGNTLNIHPKQLWLKPIPPEIFLQDLIKKYKYQPTPYHINPIIGEYDDPTNQQQGLLNLDLTNNGNTVIWGMSGSGKENFIITTICSICMYHSPEEINFYILDFGSESLKIFSKFPHVGDVATTEEKDKIMNLFIMLDKELDKRKELFIDYGGSYNEYCQNNKQKLPMILVIINNYDVFNENYNQLANLIVPMIRESSKYGIQFLFTTLSPNSIRIRVAQYFNNKICLQLADSTDYRNLLNSPRNLIPSSNFGRGLIAVNKNTYEFQTALIGPRNSINKIIKNLNTQLNEMYKTKAPNIDLLPEIITIKQLEKYISSLNNLPIGLDKYTRDIITFDFSKKIVTPIVSNNLKQNIEFIEALEQSFSYLKDTSIKIIDTKNIYNKNSRNVYYEKFEEIFVNIVGSINKDKNINIFNIIIIIGPNDFKNKLSKEGQEIFNSIITKIKNLEHFKFIFVDDYNSFKNLQVETWYSKSISHDTGIWLGQNSDTQIAINFNNLTNDMKKENFTNMAYVAEEGNTKIIKYISIGGINAK